MQKKWLNVGTAAIFVLIGVIGVNILQSWTNVLDHFALSFNPWGVCSYGNGQNLPVDYNCLKRYKDALSFADSNTPQYILGLILGLAIIYGFCFFFLPFLLKNEKFGKIIEKYPVLPFCWIILVPLGLLLISINLGSYHRDIFSDTSNASYPIYPNYFNLLCGLLLLGLWVGLFATAIKSEWFMLGLKKQSKQKTKEQLEPGKNPEEDQYQQASQAVQLNPQSFDAWINLGYQQHEIGQKNEALASANKALEILSTKKVLTKEESDKAYARAWVLRGAALSTMQGREIDAIAACDEALGYEDDNLDALYYKGRAYVFQERDNLAHQLFDRVLRHNPSHKDALLSKGSLYLLKENYKAARDIADILIRDFPNDVEGYRMKGTAYQFEGEKAGLELEQRKELLNLALASFNTALKIDPQNASIYGLLAGPYVVMGDTGKALELLNQGLHIEPNNPFLLSAKEDIVGIRTNEAVKTVTGTAGRMAVGGGIGLAKGLLGVVRIFFDALRKS